MRVFLIHGMGRTSISMLLLRHRLNKVGHRCHLFGYSVTLQPFDEIVRRFTERVERVLAEDRQTSTEKAAPYAIISHSLGGLITRAASPQLPPGFSHFVMLAPPNHPPAAAQALENNSLFRFLTRDAGSKLAKPAFFEHLPIPEIPTLIIAGNSGPKTPWLPFGGHPNDGIVGVEETHLEDLPVVEIPALHTFIMNRSDVFEMARDFLPDPASLSHQGFGAGGSRAKTS